MPIRVLAVAACAFLSLALPAAAAPLVAYDDQLRNGFSDWSWATRNMAQTAVVHGGAKAISFEPDAWGGLFFHRDLGIDTAVYDAVELWVHGGPGGGQNVRIALTTGGSIAGSDAPLAGFVTGGVIPAGQWAKARIPFSSLGVTSGTFDGFWLQDGTGGNQAAVYVDDVQLTERTTPPPPPAAVTVQIDPDADRHAINPFIYGVNFGTDAQMAALHWPVRRWGGNSTTRYSWQDDIANHANDWFFYNIEEDNPHPENLPDGSQADRFVDSTRAAGGQPILTVPLIGWTPIDRVRRWGFSVAKYGAQQQTECTASGNAPWCQPDAGNGLKPDGTPIAGNDPHDTSRAIGPDFVTGWMAHLEGRTGTAANGGVRLFALDNEPMLWNSTHRDVHPTATTYDELWQKTVDYASAMKAQDSGIKILGPVLWGWCAYFHSAADGCGPGPDQAAHGNLPFLDWYLKQVHDYETAHGVRLVDEVDIHYYPEAANVALSNDESAATAARRLRTLKSLYDPAYVDESWIGTPVRLIPRLKEWIASRVPGTPLAITEYNFGDGAGASSALAQAEALAIFGREGVDLATRWVSPPENSLLEDAFRLYLNYDGAGSKVAGDSVRAVSSDVDAVGAYAVHGAGSRLYLLLFNKDTSVRSTSATVAGGIFGSAALYRFDGSHRLAAAGTADPVDGVLTLSLPARSATLAVLEGGGTPADFYTLAPCRVVDTRGATAPLGGPALAANVDRSFPLAGACGVPATAQAIAVNVTTVAPSGSGNLRAWPGGTTPSTASVLNFAAGQTLGNNAILALSRNGSGTLTVRVNMGSGSADVLVDVVGYFQ